MKRQTWNALTRWSRPLQISLLLCGGAIVACGDDADEGAETDAGHAGAGTGKGGTGGKAGGGGNAGAAGRGGTGGTRAGSGGAGGRGGTGGVASDLDAGPTDDDGGAGGAFSFFVTSDTSKTGNLGGLTGADKRCQDLAAAAGAGSKTWHAYLSVEKDAANGGNATNARDRIGTGPWYNVKGALLAKDLTELHARNGDASLFLDEKGNKVNGQWEGSPAPIEHDVFTGSKADGTVLADRTCKDWTSESMSDLAQVGHSDGLGPNRNGAPPYNSWSSVHENGGCNDTAPRGGAGKLYCFAVE